MLHPIFYRLDHVGLRLSRATIWMPLDAVGGRSGAVALGFERLGDPDRPVKLPVSVTLCADMHDDRKIVFSLADDETRFGVGKLLPLVEASFPDAHPEAWVSTAHEYGQILVLASERDFSQYPTAGEALLACWGLLVPLVIRGYPEGVGTARPPGS